MQANSVEVVPLLKHYLRIYCKHCSCNDWNVLPSRKDSFSIFTVSFPGKHRLWFFIWIKEELLFSPTLNHLSFLVSTSGVILKKKKKQ